MRFVVIDFEATCDEPYNPEPQEIIEFPAVVVDPGGVHDAAEFHTFVRPVAHHENLGWVGIAQPAQHLPDDEGLGAARTVEQVTAHSSPQPAGRPGLSQNPDASRDLTKAVKPKQGAVAIDRLGAEPVEVADLGGADVGHYAQLVPGVAGRRQQADRIAAREQRSEHG